MTPKPEYHQRRVSDDSEHNKRLTDKDRIENLEFDSMGQWVVLSRIADQNDKYADYLDKKIKAEENNSRFWKKQFEMLVSGGIKGAILALFGGLLYAFIHWVKTL
jgi:hypothetical protein